MPNNQVYLKLYVLLDVTTVGMYVQFPKIYPSSTQRRSAVGMWDRVEMNGSNAGATYPAFSLLATKYFETYPHLIK